MIPFSWHVAFADTDSGGVVYHTRYLEWAERARADWLRQHGYSNTSLQQQGMIFAVKALTVTYHRPARLDQLLSIQTQLIEQRGARLLMQQTIRGEEQNTYVTIDLTLACLGTNGTPMRIPVSLSFCDKDKI